MPLPQWVYAIASVVFRSRDCAAGAPQGRALQTAQPLLSSDASSCYYHRHHHFNHYLFSYHNFTISSAPHDGSVLTAYILVSSQCLQPGDVMVDLL
jgi:hypothetical protein